MTIFRGLPSGDPMGPDRSMRSAAEAAGMARRRAAERRDLSVKRWAVALALWCAFLAFDDLVSLWAGPPAPPAAFVVESVTGGTPGEAQAVREALIGALAELGAHDASSPRRVRILLDVTIGPPEPGAEQAVPVEVLWRVREGLRRLGTIRQTNTAPAGMEASRIWDSIVRGAVPVAAKPIADLVGR